MGTRTIKLVIKITIRRCAGDFLIVIYRFKMAATTIYLFVYSKPSLWPGMQVFGAFFWWRQYLVFWCVIVGRYCLCTTSYTSCFYTIGNNFPSQTAVTSTDMRLISSLQYIGLRGIGVDHHHPLLLAITVMNIYCAGKYIQGLCFRILKQTVFSCP